MNNEGYGGYVQKVRDDTTRWLAQLKGDNEKLRRQVVALESERNRLQQEKLRLLEQLVNVREELSSHLEDHTRMIRRLGEAEQESARVSEQFFSLEAQNTNLANLYVAAYQMRSSLERGAVLDVMKEIIVNMIGSENFGIFERNGDHLDLIGWFDRKPDAWERIPVGAGVIGRVAETGETFSAKPGDGSTGVTTCIPMRVDEEIVGVIAIFSLLPQKDEVIEALDRELLDLLSSQAGIALRCAGLYAEHRRKGVA